MGEAYLVRRWGMMSRLLVRTSVVGKAWERRHYA